MAIDEKLYPQYVQTMVQQTFSPDTNKQRSRSGCVRCKRRRQKCDEAKPRCGRCNDASISCEYSVQLKWGGRTFGRSRFGVCLKGIKKIENTTDGFIYATSAKGIPTSRNEISLLPQELQLFPSLSVSERSLLSHFAHEASRVTCCHANVQTELCQLIIPIAAEVPSLMYATLTWSAIHSMAFGRHVDTVSNLPQLVATLKAKSIEHLRREIQQPDEGQLDALLATVRTLCQCEIHSGSDVNSVWRLHVRGARALMSVIKRSKTSMCTRSRLLCRWYASLESLAALTPSTYAPAQASHKALSEELPETVYLDDYNGYSTELSSILGKIGSAAELHGAELQVQADELEEAIYHIMERDNNQKPVFYPGVAEKLSQQDIREYSLCNQAYQHTALIHIQRRLRDLPSTTSIIQNSVNRVIECARAITPAYGLSPAIVLTTPLFTAGCEALGKDRTAVRELLSLLFDKLKIRNIKLALEVLEDHWADDGYDRDWRSLLRRKNWDFIPY